MEKPRCGFEFVEYLGRRGTAPALMGDFQHGGGYGIEFDCGPRAVGKSLNWPTCHFLRPRIQEAKART